MYLWYKVRVHPVVGVSHRENLVLILENVDCTKVFFHNAGFGGLPSGYHMKHWSSSMSHLFKAAQSRGTIRLQCLVSLRCNLGLQGTSITSLKAKIMDSIGLWGEGVVLFTFLEICLSIKNLMAAKSRCVLGKKCWNYMAHKYQSHHFHFLSISRF